MSHPDFTRVQLWTISADEAGQRLDNYLFTRLKGVPKSHVYRILRKGEVRVNKKRPDPAYRLQAGDAVRIPPLRVADKPVSEPTHHLQQKIIQSIIYEDDDLLVINKPAGVAVHGGSGVAHGVIEVLRQAFPKEKGLELVHRLDRDTSGCLVVAKRRKALLELHDLWRGSAVVKRYWAVVKGYWPRYLKQVDATLAKYQLRSGERMVQVNADEGKEARTDFRVIERLADTTLVEAQLHTGRTHQIRVHALHAGYPIVGDEKYGDKEFNQAMRAQGAKRLMLHAAELSFRLANGKKIEVHAEPEAMWQNFVMNQKK